MAMNVVYSIGGCVLGGSGIGRIAGHAVLGLQRHRLLAQVIVGRSRLEGIESSSLTIVPSHIPGLGRILPSRWSNAIGDTLHGYFASLKMNPGGSHFHGWAGMSLPAVKKARRLGIAITIERASTHILEQKRIVEAEYAHRGVKTPPYNDWHVSQELKEYELADRIIVPSAFVKDSFLRQGFQPEKIVVVPFGVEMKSDTTTRKSSQRGDELSAVFVGEVGLRKGILYALEAWQQSSVKKGMFYVAGPISAEIKPFLSRYESDPTIQFTGFVDPRPYYNKSDVFIFPSLEEGSALVTYEAMANGLPLIVTPNAGSLVNNKECGVVVAPGSVDEILQALELFASNKNLGISMGQSGQELIKHYDWNRYGDSIAKLYLEK